MAEQYIASIDQGTTSSRTMIFNHEGRVVAVDQTRTRADLPQGRVGRAQRHRDLGERPGHHRRGVGQGRPQVGPDRRGRHHQPAGDRAGLGPHHRRAGVQRDRLAGHPHRRHRPPARRTRRRPGPVQGQGRAAAGHLLLRAQGPLDPGQRRRRQGEGRQGRPGVRQHGHLGAVEHDRRGRRRPAHHRPDQRLPDHADGPGHADLGRRHRRGDGHSAVDAPGDPLVLRGLRQGPGRRQPARCADRRRPR